MRVNVFAISLVVCLSLSCKQVEKKSRGVNIDSIDLSDMEGQMNDLDTIGVGIPIFYNMYLSVELSSLFEASGTVFTQDILNSTKKNSQYLTSYKKAMNLGVFAVDLSYARVFEQYEVAGRYFSAMQDLSEKLGIPTNYFEKTAERFENNLINKDTLIAIANEVYYETESYLKENERFATASVIILGGWIEAVYIGTHVAIESGDFDVLERLVDQKYSLNNLLIMLSDYRDFEFVAEYLEQLEQLREIFMSIEIEAPVASTDKFTESKQPLKSWRNDILALQEAVLAIRSDITN